MPQLHIHISHAFIILTHLNTCKYQGILHAHSTIHNSNIQIASTFYIKTHSTRTKKIYLWDQHCHRIQQKHRKRYESLGGPWLPVFGQNLENGSLRMRRLAGQEHRQMVSGKKPKNANLEKRKWKNCKNTLFSTSQGLNCHPPNNQTYA